MATFVLIMILYGTGKAIDHVEFTTLENCQKASVEFNKSKDNTWTPGYSFCVEK